LNQNTENLLSIIVPAFNEQGVLPDFHHRLCTVLDDIFLDAEIIYVNDGSQGDTFSIIEQLHNDDARVTLLDLSRNFGKEIALTAGLRRAMLSSLSTLICKTPRNCSLT